MNDFTFLLRRQTGPDLHAHFRTAEISCAFQIFGSTPRLTVFPKWAPQFLQCTVPLLFSCAFKINICNCLFQYFNPLLHFLGHDGYSLQSPGCSLWLGKCPQQLFFLLSSHIPLYLIINKRKLSRKQKIFLLHLFLSLTAPTDLYRILYTNSPHLSLSQH